MGLLSAVSDRCGGKKVTFFGVNDNDDANDDDVDNNYNNSNNQQMETAL